MKAILCFGDSNTWGADPDSTDLRLPYHDRWVTVLQHDLGDEYVVFPEGLNGRTTVFDDPFAPHRSGAAVLPMVLDTHAPIELVIIMLGTNDTKAYFNASAVQIAMGMRRLGEIVAGSDAGRRGAPGLLMVAPPPIGRLNDVMRPHFAPQERAVAVSRTLAAEYRLMAGELGCGFFDGGSVAATGSDGVHLDAAAHRSLGSALAGVVHSGIAGGRVG